jgi:hypothetical protein
MTAGPAVLRRVALGLGAVVVLLSFATARAVWVGEAELKKSDRAFDAGRVASSLEHAERAAVEYAPGAPHVSLAFERMQAVASGAERRGQFELALDAWRAIRSALLQTRHPLSPDSELLERANGHIARLEAEMAQAPRSVQAELQAQLEETARPHTLRLLLLGGGLGALVLGLFGFALFAVPRQGPLRRGPLWLASGAVLLGLLCWVFAAVQA